MKANKVYFSAILEMIKEMLYNCMMKQSIFSEIFERHFLLRFLNIPEADRRKDITYF